MTKATFKRRAGMAKMISYYKIIKASVKVTECAVKTMALMEKKHRELFGLIEGGGILVPPNDNPVTI